MPSQEPTEDDQVLLIDTTDRVRTLTLNRPQSRNALSAALRTRFYRGAARGRGRRRRRRRDPHRRRPGVLRGPGPQGTRRHHGASRHLAQVAGDEQAGDRRDQRRGRHRRPRTGAVLRHPDRLGERPLRRHPRPRRAAAHLGAVGAAAAEGRRRAGPADEPDRRLPVRRRTRCAPAWSPRWSRTTTCCPRPAGWPRRSSATTRRRCVRCWSPTTASTSSRPAPGCGSRPTSARQWMRVATGDDIAANRAAVLERGRAQVQLRRP